MKSEITNQHYSAWRLIDLIQKGDLILPSVQRDFDWKSNDIIDFLHSIIKGHPLGPHFYFWTPNEDEIATIYSNARGIGTGLDKDRDPNGINFIIDGQQRLTSIFRVLTGDFPVAFNPLYSLVDGSKMFKVTSSTDVAKERLWPSPKATLIPLSKLKLHNVDDILNATPQAFNFSKVNEDQQDEIRKNIEHFLVSFQELSFESKLLREISYKETSEIFINLNKKGKTVKTLDAIVMPLFLEKFPEFKNKISDFVLAIEKDFPEFSNTIDSSFVMLNVLYALQGYSGSAHLIKHKDELELADLEQSLKISTNGIRHVLNLLDSALGVDTSTLISAEYSIHVLAIAYGRFVLAQDGNHRAKPTAQQRKASLLYFIISNLNSRYSNKGHNEVRKMDMNFAFGDFSGNENTDAFLQLGKSVLKDRDKGSQKDRWVTREQLEGTSLLRKASFMFSLLGIVLKSNKAPGFHDGDNFITLSESHKHHIFPRAKIKEHPDLIGRMNNIGNITYIHGDPNKFEFSDKYPSEYLKDLSSFKGSSEEEIGEALSKHFITSDEKMWNIEKFDEFLNYRLTRMTDGINAFIEEYV